MVEYYGIILIGTSEGNIIEMLWPLPEDPSTYKCKVSNSPVLSIKVAESYKELICLTASSEVILLEILQYIEGGQTAGVYVFESARRKDLYEF